MHAEVHVAYGLDDDGTGDPAPGPTTQPSSDSTDPRAGAGRTFPQRGEGRPSHKSLAVTYAATIVATRRTNTLAPNHPWLRNPRPLCEHLRPHDMIASCGEPGLPAAFAPASIALSSNRRAPAIRLTEHPADDRQPIAERERPRGGAVADVKNAHIVQPGARPDGLPPEKRLRARIGHAAIAVKCSRNRRQGRRNSQAMKLTRKIDLSPLIKATTPGHALCQLGPHPLGRNVSRSEPAAADSRVQS